MILLYVNIQMSKHHLLKIILGIDIFLALNYLGPVVEKQLNTNQFSFQS